MKALVIFMRSPLKNWPRQPPFRCRPRHPPLPQSLPNFPDSELFQAPSDPAGSMKFVRMELSSSGPGSLCTNNAEINSTRLEPPVVLPPMPVTTILSHVKNGLPKYHQTGLEGTPMTIQAIARIPGETVEVEPVECRVERRAERRVVSKEDRRLPNRRHKEVDQPRRQMVGRIGRGDAQPSQGFGRVNHSIESQKFRNL